MKTVKAAYGKFHNNVYAPIFYGVVLLALLAGGVLINLILIPGPLAKAWDVMLHWNVSDNDPIALDPERVVIQKGLWQVGATLVAGMAMALGAIAAQSLTRNSLAEGSTLGLVQGAIFGIIFIISMGFTGFLMRYLFAIIFSFVGALLVVLIIFVTKSKSTNNKIILAGLAIGIVFKTLSFVFKEGDKTLSSINFAYVLGGAEAISNNSHTNPQDYLNDSLMWSTILVAVAMLVTIINIKGMNLLELGEDRAKTLGSKPMLTKGLAVLTIALAIPAGVVLVGNLAFVGLFSVHIARWFVKSRNYAKVMPITILVAMLIASFGLQLSQHIPSVNSGIWMTFVGAPYLIYVGLKGVK